MLLFNQRQKPPPMVTTMANIKMSKSFDAKNYFSGGIRNEA